MSLGKAVCLHSLNPIKTSSRISSHIPHISVYCSWAFIPQDRRLGFILQHTWDWQTNKQTGLWATRGDGGHGAGGPLPVSLSRRATNAGRAESLGQRTDSPTGLTVHGAGNLWSVYLKRDPVDTSIHPSVFYTRFLLLSGSWWGGGFLEKKKEKKSLLKITETGLCSSLISKFNMQPGTKAAKYKRLTFEIVI